MVYKNFVFPIMEWLDSQGTNLVIYLESTHTHVILLNKIKHDLFLLGYNFLFTTHYFGVA